ncbi:Hypothetical predicted protein [Olea europaea subsp. europaea]|uniref:Uncharacterized protein n=1 Tax=Olea europaea subsp. europaea TaxID=158383 RepID=A0A8S0VMP2_OLEEU|nr:Hypothetical predicted protein [Olea europaea subsp. europaea]
MLQDEYALLKEQLTKHDQESAQRIVSLGSVIDWRIQMDSCWAGRIATDESRSAADSLAVGFVPQDSATGTRSEESTAAISTHLYEF